MAAGINYFRLLWNLYRQKRNTGRKKEQVRRMQKKKLEKMLLYAYDHSPYYRKAFEAEGIFRENIRTMPLERFPTLDKGILMEHFDELVTDRSLKQGELLRFDENSEDDGEIYLDKYHVVHSSGSTGTPRYFVYDNVTCLYNFTQPLIRYRISDKLVLHEAKTDTDCFFTRADVLLCRNEDVLWFERPDGGRECRHPLSMEGFCMGGLLDYQFCQTSATSFEMLAEIGESAEPVRVTGELLRQVRKLLADKNLEEIQFSVRFVGQITPDQHTGKKPLIIRRMEDKKNDKDKHYRKAI